jgi:hypothetical protein
MALTITDEIMRSDQTAHTARLGHFEAGDAWRVSWLPHRLMDRNAAITAMTLADLASQGEGISSLDDPRWPTFEALAAELGLSGPDAVVRISEPGPGTAHGPTLPGWPVRFSAPTPTRTAAARIGSDPTRSARPWE